MPFKTTLLKEIFRSYHPSYSSADLLTLWTLTGGVARYVNLLMSEKAFSRKAMLAAVFDPTSSYLDETAGKLSFFEVKTDARRVDLDVLRRKTEAFFVKNPEKRSLDISLGGLSLDDM